MYYEFFRNQYDHEWNQRNVHNAATAIPMTILAVIASATSAMLVDFPYKNNVSTALFVQIQLLFLVQLIARSFYCIYRSYWGHEYNQLASAQKLYQYKNELTEFVARTPPDNDDTKVSEETEHQFVSSICKLMAEATDVNAGVNSRRATYLHKAVQLIAWASIWVAIAGACYVCAKASAPEKVYQVKVVTK